jgi:regulator of sigma E protease
MPDAAVLNLACLQLSFLGLESLGGILATVLGFGILVFVHELGHFLAAKWVGVRVEVFSLGFGPRLVGFMRGTTDYRISALPLGGYVKMLGQADDDPNLPRTNSPDDFRNKSISGRMLILIAGVVMNTIFALIAFIVAFAVGVEFTAPEVGAVQPNSAASQARIVGAAPTDRVGLAPNDQILAINGTEVLAWEDVTTTIALSSGPITLDVARPDSATGAIQRLTFEATPKKDEGSPFPKLGIEYLQVVADNIPEDSPAKKAGLKKDDQILDVVPKGESPTGRDLHLIDQTIRDNPGKPVTILVLRREYDPDGRPLVKPPQRLELDATTDKRSIYDLGVTFDEDTLRVESVQDNSPAKALLEPDDILVSIDDRKLNNSNLFDVIRETGDAHHQKDAAGGAGGRDAPHAAEMSDPVKIVYSRRKDKTWETKDGTIQLKRKENAQGWLLGVVCLADKVKTVEPSSPAAEAKIEPGDFIVKYKTDTFLGFYKSGQRAKKEAIQKTANEKELQPWKLYWEKPDGTQLAEVIHARKTDKQYGDLGVPLTARSIIVRRSALASIPMGADRTVRMFQQLVYTLRGLFSRNVSTSELGGPIQIATITYRIASSNGLGKLFYFLAILSVNLAVLNILPIPVLDGGHIFLLSIEKLKGRPLSQDVMNYVQYAGLFFVVGLMIYVTFNDIRRFFQ